MPRTSPAENDRAHVTRPVRPHWPALFCSDGAGVFGAPNVRPNDRRNTGHGRFDHLGKMFCVQFGTHDETEAWLQAESIQSGGAEHAPGRGETLQDNGRCAFKDGIKLSQSEIEVWYNDGSPTDSRHPAIAASLPAPALKSVVGGGAATGRKGNLNV